MADKSQVICHDILGHPFPGELLTHGFDIIFMDPPYDRGHAEATLGKYNFMDLMARGARVIVEQSARETLRDIPNSLDIYRQKKYSKTFISFLSASTTE